MNPRYKFEIALLNDNDRFTTFNESKFYEINPATGELELNSSVDTTDYIEIPKGKLYLAYISIIGFYDANKLFIAGQYHEGGKYIYNIANVPENAVYIRVTGRWREDDTEPHIAVAKNILPIYKSDLAINTEQETNEKFYRNKLSGKLSFVRDDYKTIINTMFDTTYILLLSLSEDGGYTWRYVQRSKFARTDCRVDMDDQIIEVSPEPIDEYTDVLAGMDKEFNLVELAPEIDPVIIYKRPLMQVYFPGDDVVSCFLGGMYWEQDAEKESNPNNLMGKYKFTLSKVLKLIKIKGNDFGAAGDYYGDVVLTRNGIQTTTPEFVGRLYPRKPNGFYLIISITERDNIPKGDVLCEIRKMTDDEVYYRYERKSLTEEFANESFTMECPPGSGRVGKVFAEMTSYDVYSRYILDVDVYKGVKTEELPTDDIVGNNRNYRRAIGIKNNTVYMSLNTSKTPTEWGRRDDGTYFAPPQSAYGNKFLPVGRSAWVNVSFWFRFSQLDWRNEAEGRKEYELRDAFPIWSVIKVLLKKIAPGITHEGTPEYSQFLYKDNNPLSGDTFRLYVSPKSNIINGEYQTPAQQSPTTLKEITEMLRNVFKCYWYIEDAKFKIEHVEYFRNGGSYIQTAPVVGYDLTQIENIRNGKKWGYDSSAYSFDKAEMAERIEFEWMDDVTDVFRGQPIEVHSKFVNRGKIEKINVGNFTSDIDMMILSPGDMSPDGFALFATVDANIIAGVYTPGGLIVEATDGNTEDVPIKAGYDGSNAIINVITRGGGTGLMFFKLQGAVVVPAGVTIVSDGKLTTYNVSIPPGAISFGFTATGTIEVDVRGLYVPGHRELPFVRQNINGVEYVMQNGYLSFVDLQPNYWVYDAPAYQLEVNGEIMRAKSIERRKKQDVRFPAEFPIEPLKSIKTYIGFGQIEKFNVNLSSKQTKATIRYDTTN